VSTRVDKLLTEPDPETARSVYQEALASLKRDFPRRFRAQYDPWPNAEIRLARLDAKIEAAEASQLGEAVRQLLGATYRIVLSGDLRKARSELVVGAAGRAAPSLPRHIQLLDAAIAVRGELLASLLGTRKVYKLKGVRTLEGALDVELRRRAGQLVLQPAGGQESIALGLLRVSDLVPPGFIAGLSDEHKVGLAVWFLLTGAEEFAFLVEGSPWSQFVRDELAPLLRNLKRPEPGWLADRRLFESVRKAVKAREWAVARKSMTSLRARPGSFAADNDQELRSLGRAIEEGLAQADLQRSLQARVMGGGQLQVDARLAVALVYPDLSKVTFPEGLPPGWARDAGDAGVAFELDGVALGDARALSFASLCATGKPMSVRFEFSFSSDRGATRLFFLTMHEASLGLAALRDGRVVVFDVSKLREGKELRSRVQRALRFAEEHSGAWLVPGARHRLDIDVRPRGFGGKVVLTPRLDGRALPEVSIVRATGRVPAVVRLTALHSLQAYSLSVHGSGQ